VIHLEPGIWLKWPYRHFFGLAVFLISLGGLYRLLADVHYEQVNLALQAYRWPPILLALTLIGVSHLAFIINDALAMRYIGRPPFSPSQIPGSFINAVFRGGGWFAALAGESLRSRLFSGWQLSGSEVSRALLFCALTYWLGLASFGGLAFLLAPSSSPFLARLPVGVLQPLGAMLMAAAALYVALAAKQKTPRVMLSQGMHLPGMLMVLAQLAISVLDWAATGGALYVLLPSHLALPWHDFVVVFLICQTIGVLSPVPGGLAVFEFIFIYFLSPFAATPQLLGTLLAYRLICQLLPIGLATALSGWLAAQARIHAHIIHPLISWTSALLPPVLAVATFLTGSVMLISGAMPELPGRLGSLAAQMTLPVLEASYFLSSLVGAALLLIARSIQRRLDTAFWATVACLAAGIVFVLLKDPGYLEALLLGLVLAALLPARKLFWRKGSLISGNLGSDWITAIVAVLASSLWILAFTSKSETYSTQLWWRFLLSDSVPRSLRAMAGAMCLVLLYGVAMLFRPARQRPTRPTAEEIEKAGIIAAQSPRVSALRVLAGDKMLLFNAGDSAFLMYGIQGDSWIALGDPVGAPEEQAELVWRFREMCDRFGGRLVFYQVEERDLSLYVDLGLSLYRLGEEARVALQTFSLEGGDRRGLRHTHSRAQRAGLSFEILPAADVNALLPELKVISDAWLKDKNTHEKGFSVGFFDTNYLRRCPLAVVRCDGRIIAFANVTIGAAREELSVDLMRALPQVPYGTMEFLFIEIMQWGQAQGYSWFNLGMAPLSDERAHATGQWWDRFGALIFQYGEHFYNFKGVRDFKEQFRPSWSTKYLAIESGRMLPRAIVDTAALIAGGYRSIVSR